MKLRTLTAALVLAGFSAGAIADVPSTPPGPHGQAPYLTIPEFKMYAILEALLSQVAGWATDEDCPTETLSLAMFVNDDLIEVDGSNNQSRGTVDQTTVRIPTVNPNTLGPGLYIDQRGLLITVWEDPILDFPGEIDEVQVDSYLTRGQGFGFDFEGAMMYAAADFRLHGVYWDEHIIKDFWRGDDKQVSSSPVDGSACRIVNDDGLELITKDDFPRSKWHQYSWYQEPNGCDGYIDIWKFQIAPDTANLCAIHLFAELQDLGDGLQIVGAPFGTAYVSVLPVGQAVIEPHPGD